MPPPPPRPPPVRSPFIEPPELYDKAAEVLAEWLRLRCVDGLVLGGAPGLVITGKAGCGKLTAVRWAMRQAGLDPAALEVFHPWSSASAASIEAAMVRVAFSSGRTSLLRGRKALPYRVLVLKHAELWALRSGESPASAAPAAGASTFAYWSKLFRQEAGGGGGGESSHQALPSPPARVAVVLLFPDLSHTKARTLVGLRQRRAMQGLQGLQEVSGVAQEAGLLRGKEGGGGHWKHIDLDHGLLLRLGRISDRIASLLRRSPTSRLPFDGDLRAVFRRLADSCRFSSPHKLDMNYNIFRATSRLLGAANLTMNDVRGAAEQDDRIAFMLWYHCVQTAGLGAEQVARDRALWSHLEPWLAADSTSLGWAIYEWRLRRIERDLTIGATQRQPPLTFEMPPAGNGRHRTAREAGSSRMDTTLVLPTGPSQPPRLVEYGFRWASF